ncbi:MAG: hypothetical protein ABSE62_06240 [Chthoniobacteraceae bacterium]
MEDRIAPAVLGMATISSNGKSATYLDAAGDTVTATTSKGTFDPSQFMFTGASGVLTELSLTGHSDFKGANIVFSIVPVAGGTDTVNVGYIDAIGLNLGSITVPGDLARIDVGKSGTALGKLTVQSLGAEGTSTQGGIANPSVTSNITGAVGSINVAGNIDGTVFVESYTTRPGPPTGNIGQLYIGGSLDGNTAAGAGEVFFSGTLGKAVIQGGIEGGSPAYSGSIGGYGDTSVGGFGTLSKIGSITVNGSVPDDPNPSPLPGVPGTSILGGSGGLSGSIDAATIGSVYVAGDIFGGTGTASGAIQAGLRLGKAAIAGSLIGGNFTAGSPSEANSAGLIFGGSIGSVTIGQSIYGGSGLNSGQVYSTGLIQKVTVMGDVAGGSAGTSSSSGLSGTIHGQSIGGIIIEGSLIGGNMVSGDPNQTGNTDGAIHSDTSIGGIYIGKNLVGGSGQSSGQISTGNGGIGRLTIGGADTSDGSILGGSGSSSGFIQIAGNIGAMTLTHDLTGGSGMFSGYIEAHGSVSSLKIGGDVTGGTADSTGDIVTFGVLKNTLINGSVIGSDSGATMLTDTGYIQAAGIGTMTIGDELQSGTVGTGGINTSGAIRSTSTIGSLTIGSLMGNAANPAIISAVGIANLSINSTSDVAIGRITVTGSATYADILAGYNDDTQSGAAPLGTGVSANAQIGTVTIGGTLEATNIIAGLGPGTGAAYFGTAASAPLSGGGVTDYPAILSKISKVIIAGAVESTGNAGAYGIAAQYIASAKVDGAVLSLLAGPDNDTFAAGKEQTLSTAPGNVFLYEV